MTLHLAHARPAFGSAAFLQLYTANSRDQHDVFELDRNGFFERSIPGQPQLNESARPLTYGGLLNALAELGADGSSPLYTLQIMTGENHAEAIANPIDIYAYTDRLERSNIRGQLFNALLVFKQAGLVEVICGQGKTNEQIRLTEKGHVAHAYISEVKAPDIESDGPREITAEQAGALAAHMLAAMHILQGKAEKGTTHNP